MTIGARLRSERDHLGYSQEAFAALVGASKKTQGRWEQDESHPDAAALATWAGNGLDPLYVLIGRRSIAPIGMAEAEIEAFNRLVNLFWSASDETRASVFGALTALHARDVQAGTARGARKAKMPREDAAALHDSGKSSKEFQAELAQQAAPPPISSPGSINIHGGKVKNAQITQAGDINNTFGSGRKKR